MRCLLTFGALVMGLLVIVPGDVLGQKKKDADKNADSRNATMLDYTALSRYRETVGKLQNVDTRAGTVSFMIEITRAVLEKKGNNQPARNNRKGKGRPANVMVVQKTERIEFELKVLEKAPFRKQTLAVEYDARGNLKEYTPEEKIKLKGTDPNLPGYMANIDELKPGTPVKLYLNPAKVPAAKDDPMGGRPIVRMVMLLPEPDKAMQKKR